MYLHLFLYLHLYLHLYLYLYLAQVLDMRSEGVPSHLLESALQEAEAAEAARQEAEAAQYEYDQYEGGYEQGGYEQGGYGATGNYEGYGAQGYGANFVQGSYDAAAGYDQATYGTSEIATGDEVLQPNQVFHFGNGELKVASRGEEGGVAGKTDSQPETRSFWSAVGDAIMKQTSNLCVNPRKPLNAAQADLNSRKPKQLAATPEPPPPPPPPEGASGIQYPRTLDARKLDVEAGTSRGTSPLKMRAGSALSAN